MSWSWNWYFSLIHFVFQKLEADKSGNVNIEVKNIDDSNHEKKNATSKKSLSPKKKNEMKAPKQLQPPKIHFEDKKGVVGKGGAENVNDPPENMEDDENKEENGKRVYEWMLMVCNDFICGVKWSSTA